MNKTVEHFFPWKSVIRGAAGFSIVSLAGFAVWAFAGKWFYKNVGEAGLYLVSTVVFVGLSGPALYPLVEGSNRLGRFYKAFIPAFVAYAVVWSACWFLMGFGAGEWLGSLAGCCAFSVVLGKGLKARGFFLKVALFLFVTHSVGYFPGSFFYSSKETLTKLLPVFSEGQIALCAKFL